MAWNLAELVQPEVEQLVGGTELAYFLAMLAVFVAALIVLVDADQCAVALGTRASAGSPSPTASWAPVFGVLNAWMAVGTAFLFYGCLDGPPCSHPRSRAAPTFPMIKEMAARVEPCLPPGSVTGLQDRGSSDAGVGFRPLTGGLRGASCAGGNATAHGDAQAAEPREPPQ